MSALDRELIRRQLEALRDYRQKLEEFYPLDRPAFVGDHHHYGLAEHYLQQAIESVLNVCRALVVGLGLRMPDEPRGLLTLLGEANVLTKDFVTRNASMVGFRNILVHNYLQVDHGLTLDYLHEHLIDFDEFIRQVSQYLSREDKA